MVSELEATSDAVQSTAAQLEALAPCVCMPTLRCDAAVLEQVPVNV